jgi:hypothetical protein
MHPLFLDSLEQLQKANIHVNEALKEKLFTRMMRYQSDTKNPDFPLWLVTRELGGRYSDWTTNESADFSYDVFTIVLEEYFHNYQEGLGFIFYSLKRISRNNIDIEVIAENTYDEEEAREVTIQFRIGGEKHTATYEDEYGDGSLSFDFAKNELISKIKGAVTKGHLFWMNDGESCTFIYSEEPAKFLALPYEREYEQL